MGGGDCVTDAKRGDYEHRAFGESGGTRVGTRVNRLWRNWFVLFCIACIALTLVIVRRSLEREELKYSFSVYFAVLVTEVAPVVVSVVASVGTGESGGKLDVVVDIVLSKLKWRCLMFPTDESQLSAKPGLTPVPDTEQTTVVFKFAVLFFLGVADSD